MINVRHSAALRRRNALRQIERMSGALLVGNRDDDHSDSSQEEQLSSTSASLSSCFLSGSFQKSSPALDFLYSTMVAV
jgi:hypothetical protein